MNGKRKRIAKVRSRVAVDKGSAKQRRKVAWVVQRIGGGSKIESVCALDVGVEGAKARPDAAFARIAKELVQKPTGEVGRVGQSNPGAEVVPAGIDEVLGNAGVAGETISHGSRGEDFRLASQRNVRVPIQPVRPKRRGFPTDPVIQGQIRFHAPTVLPIDPNVKVPQIKGGGSALGEIVGSANQHIRQVVSGLTTAENKKRVATVIDLGDGHVVPVVVPPEFNGMGSPYFREVILELVRLIVRDALHHILSHPIVVEPDPRPILSVGAFQLIDAPLRAGGGEADRLEGGPLGSWFSVVVVVTHIAGGKLVDGATAEVSGNAKREQLRLAHGLNWKTRERAGGKRTIGLVVHPGVVMPIA